MNKDEVLILKPQFPVKSEVMCDIHKKLIEQVKTGVVLIPFGYEVVVAPKDVEIQTKTKVMTEDEYNKSKTEEFLRKVGTIC